jgi:hypothetical protein
MLATRPISERRAAAARANGAKSRGPVTPRGKANSARNSLRHGLRSETLFADRKSDANWTAILASYTRELNPQSEIEQALVETIALSDWSCLQLRQLETTLVARKTNPETNLASAFRAATDGSCALELLSRLESRFSRDYTRAFKRLRQLRTRPASHVEKANINERTQQSIENKQPPHGNEASATLL